MLFNLKKFPRLLQSAQSGFDIQALQQVQVQPASTHANPAQEACEQGFALLRTAEADNFQDKNLLQQAGQVFSQVLQQHPGCVEAYLGMAELFICVQRKQKAQEYLLQAGKIQPGHPGLERLTHLLQAKNPVLTETEKAIHLAENLEHWLMSVHAPHSATDFEELYHKTEKFLKAYIRGLSYQSEPMLSGDQTQIQLRHAHLCRIQAQVRAIFKLLECEFDLHALENLLRPYETLIRNCQSILDHAKQVKALSEVLEAGFIRVAQINDLLIFCPGPEELRQAEHLLEALMDHCDAFADQLDQLEQEGRQSLALLKNYEKLILVVETLSDQMDELSEEVGGLH